MLKAVKTIADGNPAIADSNPGALRKFLCGFFTVGLALIAHSAASSVVESVIFNFAVQADGFSPVGALIQGPDGNFYGVTSAGGAQSHGVIFQLTPSGVETVLHSFGATATDGQEPQAGLIQGSDGALYGSTVGGGTTGAGTLFKVTTAGEYTQLHSFSGTDGSSPEGTLLQAAGGDFYGTTSRGGPYGGGTIFKMTPAGGLTTLYSFGAAQGQPVPGGIFPVGGLVMDGAGNFYGTTNQGGTDYAAEGGVVFKMSPNFVETVLHAFNCDQVTDGCHPVATLTLGSDGNLYGTTANGGVAESFGTVYQVTPGGAFTVLHFFNDANNNDGIVPNDVTLVEGSPGIFYGTTSGGGAHGWGTVFQVTSTGETTTLYSFLGNNIDGRSPDAGLLLAKDKSLYGPTANGGGSENAGTLFKVSGVIASNGNGTAARGAQVDYLGEGKSDYTVWRPTTGYWYSIDGSGGSASGQWGAPTDLPVIGDFDGDGKSDFAVFRPETGFWYVKRSSDSQVEAQQWGAASDVPVAGDFDGDGKTDFAVYRPTTGYWYFIQSSDNAVVGKQFGAATDVPVVGDFDGDGKSDLAVFRPATGYWYITLSSTNAVVATQWGAPTDIPVTGDFDGDGKTDIAVYRPSTGYWYIIQSSDGKVVAQQWGQSTDVPVARDYDGDGKTDIAVWRPSTGYWYVIPSSSAQTLAQQWGAASDVPVNSLSR